MIYVYQAAAHMYTHPYVYRNGMDAFMLRPGPRLAGGFLNLLDLGELRF
jgi:hypothetical protein